VSVSVRVPTPLRNLTDSQAAVSADGGTVGEIIDDLDTRHPGMRERLIDESGELRRFVNLFVDDEDVRFQQGLATPVADGSTLSIVPAVAGGGRPRWRRLDEQPGGWGALRWVAGVQSGVTWVRDRAKVRASGEVTRRVLPPTGGGAPSVTPAESDYPESLTVPPGYGSQRPPCPPRTGVALVRIGHIGHARAPAGDRDGVVDG